MTRSSLDANPRLLLAAALALALAGCDAGPATAADGSAAQDDADARPVVVDEGGGQAPAPAAPLPEDSLDTPEDPDGEDEADGDEDGPTQLAQFGGAVAASAELCGKPYDPAALVTMKAKQKQLYVATGGDPAQYEADFQAGHARGKADYLAVDASQRQEFCGRIDSWR